MNGNGHHSAALNERADSIISDSMSHMSLEVNTTGTGSMYDYESSDQDQEQPVLDDDAFEIENLNLI